jgi:hypothetical protein
MLASQSPAEGEHGFHVPLNTDCSWSRNCSYEQLTDHWYGTEYLSTFDFSEFKTGIKTWCPHATEQPWTPTHPTLSLAVPSGSMSIVGEGQKRPLTLWDFFWCYWGLNSGKCCTIWATPLGLFDLDIFYMGSHSFASSQTGTVMLPISASWAPGIAGVSKCVWTFYEDFFTKGLCESSLFTIVFFFPSVAFPLLLFSCLPVMVWLWNVPQRPCAKGLILLGGGGKFGRWT